MVRGKFEPLIVARPHPQATWILGEIQKLYDIEDRARAMTDHPTAGVASGRVPTDCEPHPGLAGRAGSRGVAQIAAPRGRELSA